jgi:hypothetical protein
LRSATRRYPRSPSRRRRAAGEEPVHTSRRHRADEVWYKAYPGLTAADLARNTRIREGLEAQTMTEAEARRWLAMI